MKDLELVRCVAETGSLTAAAKQLHVSQSAASQRLTNLHARLNKTLVERRNGTMQLTVAGQRVYAAAKVITDELRATMNALNMLGQQHDGQLRIATQCYTCYRWLPFVIRSMREEHALLSIDVVPEATDSPYEALERKQIDVAIVSNSIDEYGFEEHKLFSDELFAVMHGAHELAAEKYLAATQFAGQTLVLYTGNRHAIVDKVLAPAGINQFKIVQVRITEAIIELVRSGQGIAVIAGWALDDIAETEGLSAVRITKKGFKRTWNAVIGRDCNAMYVDSFVHQLRTIGETIQHRAWRKQLRHGPMR